MPAFGEGTFADLRGNGDIVYSAAAAGVKKLLDVAVNDHQLGAQNQLAAWNVATGKMHPGFPHFVNDLQFLAGPAVADLTGTGLQDLIGGSATSDLRAITPAGAEVPGFSKNTGDWTFNVPLVTRLGTDPTLKLVSLTRSGTLFVWNTPASACGTAASPKFRHDAWNTGNVAVIADRPSTITNLGGSSTAGGGESLTFTAPHGHGACGNAVNYEVRTYSCPVAGSPPGFPTPALVATAGAAGTAETLTLPQLAPSTAVIAVSATDNATRAGGNLGSAAFLVIGSPPADCITAIETGVPETTPPAILEEPGAMGAIGAGAVAISGLSLVARRRRRRSRRGAQP